MRLRWTESALRDLEAVGDFIARDKPATAKRIVSSVFAQVESLVDFPELGRIGRIPNTRELVIKGTPYIVPYRISGDQIEILAVFHGARRWPERIE